MKACLVGNMIQLVLQHAMTICWQLQLPTLVSLLIGLSHVKWYCSTVAALLCKLLRVLNS